MSVLRSYRGVAFAALALFILATASCRTPSLPAFETSTGGWTLVTGQAVWTPPEQTTAIAGDLLLAAHPDGRVLVEFSKGSMPIAVVRCTLDAWSMEIPSQHRRLGGTGTPPPRAGWLVLARDLQVRPPPPGWEFQSASKGVMTLESASTGERLELHRSIP